MTGFDAFAILVILASAAAGWVRGGTRELITLLSFVLAAFLALVALPLTAPIGRALVNPDWAGSIAAAVASFLLVYFGSRLLRRCSAFRWRPRAVRTCVRRGVRRRRRACVG